jgi:hypothetical protein
MICELCDGCGYVVAPGVRPDDPTRRVWLKLPCGDCGGSGITHCCEGLREQPEPEDGGRR